MRDNDATRKNIAFQKKQKKHIQYLCLLRHQGLIFLKEQIKGVKDSGRIPDFLQEML